MVEYENLVRGRYKVAEGCGIANKNHVVAGQGAAQDSLREGWVRLL